MNSILKRHDFSPIVYGAPGDENVQDALYINDGSANFSAICRYKGQTARYTTRKDGAPIEIALDGFGLKAWTLYSREWSTHAGYKVPDLSDRDFGSAVAFQSYRLDTDRTRIENCVGYDMRSAYGWGASQPVPDTRATPRMYSRVQEGEIGFNCYDDHVVPDGFRPLPQGLTISLPGEQAEYVFPAIESPVKGFFERWYKRKEKAQTPAQKREAKAIIVAAVGFLQRRNPLLRAAAIGWCNRKMISLCDRNTIFCNTDSLVSTAPRPDLEIGPAMGQFKIEHEGSFAHVGMNTQWNLEKPAVRGKMAEAGEDILTGYKEAETLWTYNPFKNRLEKKI